MSSAIIAWPGHTRNHYCGKRKGAAIMMYILLWIVSFVFVIEIGPRDVGLPLWAYILGFWLWMLLLFVLTWRRLVYQDRWEEGDF